MVGYSRQTLPFADKGKGRPYSINERRVPELIPVLGSQPAGDVNHKPDGRLPSSTFRQACGYPRNQEGCCQFCCLPFADRTINRLHRRVALASDISVTSA